MNKVLLTVLVLLITATAHSQEIKIKKGMILVDSKECLKINDSDPNNVSIMDLDGNEIIFLKFIHFSKYAEIYNKITFLDQKLSFTSRSYIFTKKLLIKKLLEDKTLENCKLNPQKVERFVLKFDENVEK